MKEERKGELYIFAEALLWALFPVVTVLSFSGVSPLASLFYTTFFATLFFVFLMLVKGTWRELITPEVWKYGIRIAFFIGVCFYGLYYAGLAHTTPGNAALIALFEIVTSYVLFNIIRKETFPIEHAFGAGFMILGVLLVIGKGYTGFAVGDLLILAATFFAPIGNFYQRKAREIASSETVMFVRSAFSSVALFISASFLGESLAFSDSAFLWVILIANGVFIFGVSKLFWIEGIHRMSVTKAILLQSATPLLTILFVWLILSQAPTLWQIISIAPLMLGVVLLTGNFRIRRLPYWPHV